MKEASGHCAKPGTCHHPHCGFWKCRGRLAVARVRFPLSRPYGERLSMHVCDEHLDTMAVMFGRERHDDQALASN